MKKFYILQNIHGDIAINSKTKLPHIFTSRKKAMKKVKQFEYYRIAIMTGEN